jgi:hypothetical protein
MFVISLLTMSSMKNCTSAILAAALGFAVATQAAALPRLKVSDNKRFLVTETGQPFFWLGDTGWELFHRLNREEAETYLRNRAERRFTLIQAVVLAELNGLKDPNPYGHTPLKRNDPTQPNEDYFKHVDWIVGKANELGLYIGMLPTWGNNWHKTNGIFDPQNAAAYGEWLGKRYKDAGLVWILGGDRPIQSEKHREIIRAMARGLRQGDGGAHLITFHPPGGSGSAGWFQNEGWLDFNMRQNGHAAEFTGHYDQTHVDYNRTPVKPVLDGEPIYEDHPVSFDPKNLGHSVAADVRRPLYWDLFGGAFGHTYGHHSVWQMWSLKHEPKNFPLMPWFEAIHQPGAAQMQHGRALLESRPFLTRVPDAAILVSNSIPTAMPGAGRYHFSATRDSEGSYAMVYAPVGRPFKVRMDKISGKRVKAWWFDPRIGTAAVIGTFENRGEREFMPPAPGEMLDWVLVLDDESRGFPAPGTRK